MIKKEDLEKSTSKVFALIKGKKYDAASEAIKELQKGMEDNIEELEDALTASRKAMKDVGLMAKFIDQAVTFEANGMSAGGTSMRDQLKELDPRVSLGFSSFVVDRAKEAFGTRRKSKIVPEEG